MTNKLSKEILRGKKEKRGKASGVGMFGSNINTYWNTIIEWWYLTVGSACRMFNKLGPMRKMILHAFAAIYLHFDKFIHVSQASNLNVQYLYAHWN